MEFEDFKNIVEQENYKHDGINYTIFVTKVDNKYWGWWFCETCKERKHTNPENSIERAMLSAKTNTGGHHWANHKN